MLDMCGKDQGETGEHTVKVLEVGQLDALAHSKDVGRCAKTVDQHPDVSSVQSRDLASSVSAALKSISDVGPRGDNRTKHHQAKREKRQASNGATKPQHLSVRDKNDSQVLEDGVDGNREELKSLGTGVDHTDQKQSNREPYNMTPVRHCTCAHISMRNTYTSSPRHC